MAPRPGTIAYQLWDPAAPQASRTFDAVIAASTTQIAWAPPCAARCRVLALNLASGRQVTAELSEGRSAANAAFSPDSSFLAVERRAGGSTVLVLREDIANGLIADGIKPEDAEREASLVKATFTGLVLDLLATGHRSPVTGHRKRLTDALECSLSRLDYLRQQAP